MKRFFCYLAHEYQLQKLADIKTDLVAICFFHNLIDAKYRLPDNDELGITLERRRFGQKDRTWTPPEFSRLLATALSEDRYDYILAFYLA